MRLAGKVALVTGAGSGFGEGIARRFAEEGAAVAVVDLDGAAAQRVAGAIGGQAIAIAADVGRRDQVEAMVAETARRLGRLDLLVNNAGWSHRNKPVLEVTEEEFDRLFTVNVKAIFLAVNAALPVFRAQGGGVILNTSSTAALRPRPGLTWYNASKGAVNTATKSLAAELAPDKVRVNAICPVIGSTGLTSTFMGVPDTPENRQKFLAGIPLGRWGSVEEVAATVVFLASPGAAYITGETLHVNGGMWMV